MLSLHQYKPWFQGVLQPAARWLRGHDIHPNTVTLGALCLSAAAGLAILLFPEARWPMLLLPAVLFLRMALNALDGMLARDGGLESPLGGLLNELGDVFCDALLYLPLATLPGLPAAGIVSLCVLGIISEMTGVLAAWLSGERSYAGPMGKSDRALIIGALGLLLGLGVTPGRVTDALIGIALILVAATIIHRSRDALRENHR